MSRLWGCAIWPHGVLLSMMESDLDFAQLASTPSDPLVEDEYQQHGHHTTYYVCLVAPGAVPFACDHCIYAYTVYPRQVTYHQRSSPFDVTLTLVCLWTAPPQWWNTLFCADALAYVARLPAV
ncbi:uncharacterized protein C8Q71DRAFT_760676 [Rhodofomes roseus]|uniref:C2H2-type domain-containing protein n=1 Tax=Rhodofomes roseus TaxID=34475 RepID=A0ABQ8KF30_9APHY|nr:uncharacterized protein C8Q71DRAFT_760676 [Rhodofomes roseus]KAH9836120.1 hypothetical protein C8Q71DRAFT_760676 [Rhodofomes roseus]